MGTHDLPETAISGRWAGDRCFVYGDYTEASDLPDGMYESLTGKLEKFEEIGSLVATEMGKVFDFTMSGEGWKRRIKNGQTAEV